MNRLQTKYMELFSISVTQQYYKNLLYKKSNSNPVPDFDLVPSTETEELMKRMNLVCKKADYSAGVTVLGLISGKNGFGNNLLRFKSPPAAKLTFLMLLRNPDALVFNDIPTSMTADDIFYVSNQVVDPPALRSRLHLSTAATGLRQQDVVKKATHLYRFHHTAAVADGTAYVVHTLSGKRVAPVSVVNNGSASDLLFDLSALPSGMCKLFIGLSAEDQFYFMGKDDQVYAKGVIEIVLSDAVPANYRVIEADNALLPARPLYVLNFTSRKTLWRYTVELSKKSPLYLEMAALTPAQKIDFIKLLNIITNDNNIAFSRISATDTQFVFVSTKAIALQEVYISSTSINHDLVSILLKKNTATPILYLPSPYLNTLSTASSPNIYSDIFITI